MEEKIYNLLGIKPNGVTIARRKGYKGNRIYIRMEKLTDEQEEFINSHKNVFERGKFIRDDGVQFAGSSILLYGDTNDINTDKIIDLVRQFNFIDEGHAWIKTKVNFDTGKISSKDIKIECEVFDAYEWFLYNYLLIGKPNKIIIYECPKGYERKPSF